MTGRLARMSYSLVLRPRRATAAALAVASICLLAEVMVLLHDGGRQALLALPWTATVALATGWLWAWPRTEIDEDGLTARNHLRTLRIAWSALEDVDARLGLTATAQGRRLPIACPTRRRARRGDATPLTFPLAQDREMDTDVATAARLLVDARRVHAGRTGARPPRGAESPTPSPSEGVVVRWDLRPALLVALGAAAALATLALM